MKISAPRDFTKVRIGYTPRQLMALEAFHQYAATDEGKARIAELRGRTPKKDYSPTYAADRLADEIDLQDVAEFLHFRDALERVERAEAIAAAIAAARKGKKK